MKHVLPALVAVVCTLTACKTTADRFDLFSPDKPQGPYTDTLRGWTLAGRNNHESTTYTFPVTETPPAPPETGPVAPPPPPPPAEGETNSGAPEATPMPQAMPPTPAPAPVRPAAPPPQAAPVATPAADTGSGDNGSSPTIPGLSQ